MTVTSRLDVNALFFRDTDDDDDVYYYIRWRLKLEGETENMGVCTKERKGVTAAVLMATPCTNSLGGESGGQKHEGCGGRSACLDRVCVFLLLVCCRAGEKTRKFILWQISTERRSKSH